MSMNDIELSVLDFIQRTFKCGFLDSFMKYVSLFFGEYGVFWIIVAVILLIIPKTRKIGTALAVSFILGVIFGNAVIKNIVTRARPFSLNKDITLIIHTTNDYSFPSGHTLVCFEAATVLLKKAPKKFGFIALVIAILVALSRMYLYIHFPTDVIAGIILGIFFGLVACVTVDKVYPIIENKIGKKENK